MQFYLFLEDVVLKVPVEFWNDPYAYYYHYCLITSDIGIIPPKQPVNLPEKFRDIEEFFIGPDKYTFTYEVYPESHFDRLDQCFNQTLKLKIGEEIRRLRRLEFIKLMEEFGKSRGFSLIQRKMKI